MHTEKCLNNDHPYLPGSRLDGLGPTLTPTAAWPHGLCLDKGYDYEEIRELAREFGYTAHIRTRGEEAQQREAGKRARRWVVERTHSWLNRFRGLLVRWAKKAKNYLAFLHLACGIITWRIIGLLG